MCAVRVGVVWGGKMFREGERKKGKNGKGEEVPSCSLYVYIAKRTQLAIFDPSLSLSLRLSLHSNIVSGRKKKTKKKKYRQKTYFCSSPFPPASLPAAPPPLLLLLLSC